MTTGGKNLHFLKLIPTCASYVMKKGYRGGGQKKLHAQKKYHEIVSIVLWLKEYFKGFFFLTEY